MNRIELAAQTRVPTTAYGDIKPLLASNDVSAPILTPVIFVVTAGLAAGAAVGYIDAARHGAAPQETSAAAFREAAPTASVSDLLTSRRSSILG